MIGTNQQKDKLIGLSAVMGDMKLSKVIAEGLASPPGSSKRQKAAAILKTFKKKTQLDGMGGGELNLVQPYVPKVGGQTTQAVLNLNKPVPKTTTPTPTPNNEQNVQIMEPPQSGNVTIGQLDSSGKVIFPSAPAKRSEPAMISQMSETEKLNIPETQGQYYDQWYSGLSPEEQDKWKPLYEAVSAGVGPSTFAWGMMEDTNKLKKILPGVPEEALPQGASLARQVGDLEDSLRDEFKLDQLSSNVNRLKERGLTITDDLKGYVTARDKYIEKLDNMIDTARTSMGSMDMANPYVKQRMNNYTNYLYLMKGRQQKRYIDMVNSSIDYYNQELSRADNSYKEAYNMFTNELKNKTEITKEDYNRYKTMLEDMYNNLSGREEKELEIQKLREEVIQAGYETALDAAEVAGGGSSDGWGGLTDSQKAIAQAKYIEASDKSADEAASEFKSLSDAEKLKSYSGSSDNNQDNATFFATEILKGLQYAQSGGEKGSPSIYYDIDDKTGEGKIRWDKLSGSSQTDVQKAMAAIIASQTKDETTKEDIKSNPIKWLKYFFGNSE